MLDVKQRDAALIAEAKNPLLTGLRLERARASARFGEDGRGFDRALVVLGDRTWEKVGASLKPSAPARFLQMPLSLDRAFGGRGFDRNPLGLGFGAGGTSSASAHATTSASASTTYEPFSLATRNATSCTTSARPSRSPACSSA